MTNNGFYTAATFLISGALPAFAAEDMNIVLFMVDDMGVNDTSVRFLSGGSPLNAYYHTQNMERLAEKGVRFTRAYAHPVSSPSRVSLMTGVNPARHKVTNWTLEPDTPTDTFPRRSKTAPQPWNWNGITPNAAADAVQSNLFEATCFPEILRQNGYKTIHVGKAHWGAVGTLAADPLSLGFDVNIGGCAAGGLASYTIDDSSQPYAFNGTGDYPFPLLNGYAEAGSGFHITDAITAAAKSEIDKAVEEDRPFYLYVSHYAVHIIMPFIRRIKVINAFLTTIKAPVPRMQPLLPEWTGLSESCWIILKRKISPIKRLSSLWRTTADIIRRGMRLCAVQKERCLKEASASR